MSYGELDLNFGSGGSTNATSQPMTQTNLFATNPNGVKVPKPPTKKQLLRKQRYEQRELIKLSGGAIKEFLTTKPNMAYESICLAIKYCLLGKRRRIASLLRALKICKAKGRYAPRAKRWVPKKRYRSGNLYSSRKSSMFRKHNWSRGSGLYPSRNSSFFKRNYFIYRYRK